MSAKNRTSILQQAAISSGQVSEDELESAIEAARRPTIGPPTPLIEVTDEQLGRQLVTMGYVTEYQVAQLKLGRSRLNLGPYLVTDCIGEGGMGQVYKAEHQLMGREVALKVLPKDRMTPYAVSNFTREIRTQAILDHENLVRAYDAGHDGNVYYLVMEYVSGTDLRRLVRAQGPLTMQHAAKIICQSAKGLGYAHEKGLIHRDVKPGNILVSADGIAKVSDLGLAGFLHGQEHDPRSKKIVGTPDYISPEQILTPEQITPASDIYSLGCTLYYAITGKVPFPGGTTREKTHRHCEDIPWHPRRFNPQVSEEFVDVIAEMMDKKPEKRLHSAAEVVARLDPWGSAVTTPIPTNSAGRAWLPPPLPTSEITRDSEATEDITPNTHVGSGSQDTQASFVGRPMPPIPQPDSPIEPKSTTPLIVALAIAIPLSMILGALLAVIIMLLFR